MMKFQAVRKHNKVPVMTGIGKKKKIATFICYIDPFSRLGTRLVPRGEIIVCKIKGVPGPTFSAGGKTIERPRQLFTRFFDFYEVAK
jgi:hypothetical protein